MVTLVAAALPHVVSDLTKHASYLDGKLPGEAPQILLAIVGFVFASGCTNSQNIGSTWPASMMRDAACSEII